jgi:hypothetical protein
MVNTPATSEKIKEDLIYPSLSLLLIPKRYGEVLWIAMGHLI